MKFSYYTSKNATKKSIDYDVDQYIQIVKNDANDLNKACYQAREILKTKGAKEYNEFKSKAEVPSITGSCIMNSKEGKNHTNIEELNGLMLIDIDAKDQSDPIPTELLRKDPYTFIMHKSFSGDSYVIFVKTSCKDKDKYKFYYRAAATYYLEKYGVVIDGSCSNPNRLRYISADPDLYHEPNAQKWTAKEKEYKEPLRKDYYFTDTDNFTRILQDIQSRGLDLSNDDYDRYLRIGFAIANEFGEAGRDYFHAAVNMGTKYNEAHADKQFKYCLKSRGQGVTIATFYHYAKEAGIEIYSPRLKEIINRVSVAKKNGNPSHLSIAKNIEVITGQAPTPKEEETITRLLQTTHDYTKGANEDVPLIEQLENFVTSTYDLKYNEINNNIEVDGKQITDRIRNDIYIKAKKSLDKVTAQDIDAILMSSAVKPYHPIREYFQNAQAYNGKNSVIDQVADCLETDNPEFTRKYFKKWIVSGVQNWLREPHNSQVSPLTLVLCGAKHGTGKTTFFRNLLPDELSRYLIEAKVNHKDKDELQKLSDSMILFDDEFGGKAFKENKAFKELSDKHQFTHRPAYARMAHTFTRIALLCGTTNEITILQDGTGNRRIIPINIHSIDIPKLKAIDKNQMLSQAYELWKNDFNWTIRTQEEMDELNKNSELNENIQGEVEMLLDLFPTDGVRKEVLNKGDIMLIAQSQYEGVKFTNYHINEFIQRLKIEYKSHRLITGQIKKGVELRHNLNRGQSTEQENEMPF